MFAHNIDCGYTLEPPRRGGSNENPQSMFWIRNKKNRYTPANPSFFFYTKLGFKGVYFSWTCLPDVMHYTNGIKIFVESFEKNLKSSKSLVNHTHVSRIRSFSSAMA